PGVNKELHSVSGDRRMTPTQLYQEDTTFHSLMEFWLKEREPNFLIVERLLDFGLEFAADCARWGMEQDESPPFEPYVKLGEDRIPCRLFPTRTERGWMWTYLCTSTTYRNCNDVPLANFNEKWIYTDRSNSEFFQHKTTLLAIMCLLDHWIPTKVIE